jgi:hydroxymethylbilane synthase
MNKPIKIGTRGSKLALWQANWVKTALNAVDPSRAVELVPIKTKGDKILDVPLAKVGGKGLFVKEIEDALLNGHIDLAVHSMKDMPADLPKGLCIGAIPERENPQDVLISKNGKRLSELRPKAKVGTSSLRRKAQLLRVRPDLVILPLRGNLDTRLKKLDTEDLDAIVLAAAGVKRLDLEHRIAEYINPEIMLPAVGQGALCIEIRQKDPETEAVVFPLEHHQTRIIVTAERSFLHRLEGGCQIPIAGFGQITEDTLALAGLVASVDGTTVIKETFSGAISSAEKIGIALADRLLSRGAKKIMTQIENLNL